MTPLLNPSKRVKVPLLCNRSRIHSYSLCPSLQPAVLWLRMQSKSWILVVPENSHSCFSLVQLREERTVPGYTLSLLLGASSALGKLDNYLTTETFPMPCICSQNMIQFLRMPRLSYIKLQFPLKNCMGERVFIHSPFFLTTNTPNHTQGLHGHSKTSPRSRFSAICKLGAFWLAQRNLISRKVLMGAILSLERVSLGPENEPGTDGLSAPLEKFSLSANRGHRWEGLS